MSNRSWTLTLLAMLASLAAVAPAGAAPDAPAQEEYILELPNAGDGGRDGGAADRRGEGDPRSRAPDTVSTLTPAAGGDGSTVLVVVLAATALVGLSVAVVRTIK